MLSTVRPFGAIGLLAVLAACASAPEQAGPVMDQNNICSIFAQRPDWRGAIEASSRRWGAPVAVEMAILWRESSFRSTARPLATQVAGLSNVGYASSALGYAQAIDGTWDWYRRDTGRSGAERTRFADAADFVGWYMAKTVEMSGLAMSDAYGNYLAYHEGQVGYLRGGWQRDAGLLAVAGQVAYQATRYSLQLAGCGGGDGTPPPATLTATGPELRVAAGGPNG